MKKGLILLISTVLAWCSSNKVNQNRWFLEMEAGPVWQSRNEAKIPGTTGTKFSLKDFGGGPFLSGRVYGGYRWTDRSEFRALFAPLTLKGSRNLYSPIDFQNSTFTAGTDTHSVYKFNSYRLTYRYRLVDSDKWIFWIGFTGKIRDAKVSLEQGAISAEKKGLRKEGRGRSLSELTISSTQKSPLMWAIVCWRGERYTFSFLHYLVAGMRIEL
ncbi:MAG: hypothetical protein EXR74_02845 [Bdellovibrionales bacterium]|nr:hypothetical protein [Bdellovibrionales bacterium]